MGVGVSVAWAKKYGKPVRYKSFSPNERRVHFHCLMSGREIQKLPSHETLREESCTALGPMVEKLLILDQ